jgi:hypothetical protein
MEKRLLNFPSSRQAPFFPLHRALFLVRITLCIKMESPFHGAYIMNLVTTAVAAKFLNITPDAIRYHERLGHLLAIRVERGQGGQFQRLFVQEDLERFGRQRAAAALARQDAVTTVAESV